MVDETPEIPLTTRSFDTAERAIAFIRRAGRRLAGVVVVVRETPADPLPPEDPALAAIAAELRRAQGAALADAPAAAAALQADPPAPAS
jgi:nucleotide-binding universal stress UspA family protein